MRSSSTIEALTIVALGGVAGCSPTSDQRKDVREWFAQNRVPIEDSAIKCSSFRDDYACQVSISNVGVAQVLVTENNDGGRTMTLDNARWSRTVEPAVMRAFTTKFAGAAMEEVTCPAIVIAQPERPATCTGRFEGTAVSVRFTPRFTADTAAVVEQLELTGLVSADTLEAVARELALTTKAGELTFQCDRRVYGFGRQVRCTALSSELGDGPSLAAEFMIAADGKLSSRIVKLSAGAPWTPIPDARPPTRLSTPMMAKSQRTLDGL